MRHTCARVLAVFVVGGLLSSPAVAAPITVDYVDGGGREWASLVETANISWNTWSTACAQDGLTACASNLGALETTGWIWATRDQVRDLFYDLGVPSGGLDDYAHFEAGSSFAPFAVSAFSPTISHPLYEELVGWTATLATVDHAFGGILLDWREPGGNPDLARLDGQRLGGSPGPNVGAWLFRDSAATVTPVPEPASMLLLGTGLAGLAARRRHRRSR